MAGKRDLTRPTRYAFLGFLMVAATAVSGCSLTDLITPTPVSIPTVTPLALATAASVPSPTPPPTPTPPPPIVHVVRYGDTLIGLAERYQISVEAIMEANNLTNHLIKIGQELLIPQPTPTPTPG